MDYQHSLELWLIDCNTGTGWLSCLLRLWCTAYQAVTFLNPGLEIPPSGWWFQHSAWVSGFECLPFNSSLKIWQNFDLCLWEMICWRQKVVIRFANIYFMPRAALELWSSSSWQPGFWNRSGNLFNLFQFCLVRMNPTKTWFVQILLGWDLLLF